MIIDTVVYITTYETLVVTYILVLGTKETRVLSEYNLHLLVSQLKCQVSSIYRGPMYQVESRRKWLRAKFQNQLSILLSILAAAASMSPISSTHKAAAVTLAPFFLLGTASPRAATLLQFSPPQFPPLLLFSSQFIPNFPPVSQHYDSLVWGMDHPILAPN